MSWELIIGALMGFVIWHTPKIIRALREGRDQQ